MLDSLTRSFEETDHIPDDCICAEDQSWELERSIAVSKMVGESDDPQRFRTRWQMQYVWKCQLCSHRVTVCLLLGLGKRMRHQAPASNPGETAAFSLGSSKENGS